MFGPSGVPCAPWKCSTSGAGRRLRSGVFPASALGCLALLSGWWLPAGIAQAVSYPPTLGCAVTGTATAGSGGVRVQGMGFRAGSPVRISAGGRGTRAVADPAGSFEAWLPARALPAGTAVIATGPGCTARSLLAIENPPSSPGEPGSPSGPAGSPGGPSKPAGPGKGSTGHPAPGQPGTQPGQPGDPGAAAIPVIPPAHLPSQLFLGLAGAVLLTGAALTGLTGRWGYRAEPRPSGGASVSSSVPTTPDSM